LGSEVIELVSSAEKLLVLAVDYDDDLGRVGIETPVIGFDNVLKVAQKYALERPEDADTNTLFTALKVYRELKEENDAVEVAVIAGHEKGGSKAGVRLRSQAEEVIKLSNATSVVLVLDSAEDEFVIPVISSIAKILSIERVVVEQLRGVEETYILLGRYLRKAIEEKRFSRVMLGVPGILLLSYVLISLTPMSAYAFSVTLAILGLILVLKGFGITDSVVKMWRSAPVMRYSYVLTGLFAIITCFVAYTSISSRDFALDIISIALYVREISPYVVVTLTPLIVGKVSLKVLRRSFRAWRDLMIFALIIAMYNLASSVSNVIIESNPTNLNDVVRILYISYIPTILLIYMVVFMAASVILYVIEKEVIRKKSATT